MRAWRRSISGVFALGGFGLASWVSRLTSVRELLGLSTADVAVLVLVLAAGSVVGLAIASRLITRHAGRTVLRWTLLCFAGGLFVISLSVGHLHLVRQTAVGVLVLGAAYVANDVVMNVEGARVEKALRRCALPPMHACFSAGAIVGSMLAALALSESEVRAEG